MDQSTNKCKPKLIIWDNRKRKAKNNVLLQFSITWQLFQGILSKNTHVNGGVCLPKIQQLLDFIFPMAEVVQTMVIDNSSGMCTAGLLVLRHHSLISSNFTI